MLETIQLATCQCTPYPLKQWLLFENPLTPLYALGNPSFPLFNTSKMLKMLNFLLIPQGTQKHA